MATTLKGLLGYINDNTPKSDANSWRTIKELWGGFGNNPRNQESIDAIKGMFGLLPLGAGDVASGLLAADDVRRGDYLSAGLNGAGVLPYVPALGGMIASKGGSVAKALKQTEFEKAHEIARKNAVEMLGLPENNTAMDRAKAMGVDLENPLYFGSQHDISAFDPEKIGSRFDYSFGHHTTSRPSEASIYADSLENYSAGWNPSSNFSKPVKEGANVMPLYGISKNPLEINSNELSASMEADMNRAHIIQQLVDAKNAGKEYDAVKINAGNGEWAGNNFIGMKPSALRSRFAAFDPARINEADLLAGIGGISLAGLLGINAYSQDDKWK